MPKGKVTASGQAVTMSNGVEAMNGCDTPGCYTHNTAVRVVEVGTTKYQFQVHFSSKEDLLEHAVESMSRKVAAQIRSDQREMEEGKRSAIRFPAGRVVQIDSKVRFARTLEDEKNEILAMSQEQLAAEHHKLMAKIALLESVRNGQEG